MDMRAISITPAVPSIEVVSPRLVAELLGHISLTTLWRMRQRGEFPEPVRLSPGRCGWRRTDIEAWLTERERRVGR